MLFSTQREDLPSQFSHMTLNHQSLGETSDIPTYYLHGAPSTHSYPQPQQNYVPTYPAESYISSGMTLAMPTAPPTQTCGQQSNQVRITLECMSSILKKKTFQFILFGLVIKYS